MTKLYLQSRPSENVKLKQYSEVREKDRSESKLIKRFKFLYEGYNEVEENLFSFIAFLYW